jgi:hypothetical protein
MTLSEAAPAHIGWRRGALVALQLGVVALYFFGAVLPWLRLYGTDATPECGTACPANDAALAGLAFYPAWFQPVLGALLTLLGGVSAWRTWRAPRRPVLGTALVLGTLVSAAYTAFYFTPLGSAIWTWSLD